MHPTIRLVLRLEAAVLLAAAATAYAVTGGDWWLFAALFLLPDLAMLGYLAGPRAGAAAYNVAHATPLPAALAAAGWAWDVPVALSVGLVWLAHVGFDRMAGYGLKLPEGFGHTHLGPIGRGAGLRGGDAS